MRKSTASAINKLRLQGLGPTAISKELGISRNTVKSHIRRHPDIPGIRFCKNCRAPVVQAPGRKAKNFCCDKCRINYWNHYYREASNGK